MIDNSHCLNSHRDVQHSQSMIPIDVVTWKSDKLATRSWPAPNEQREVLTTIASPDQALRLQRRTLQLSLRNPRFLQPVKFILSDREPGIGKSGRSGSGLLWLAVITPPTNIAVLSRTKELLSSIR